MPAQKTQSKLMAKYGAKLATAVQKHAADETDYGFTRLPPGITNGIAKVTKCYFDTFKTGPNQGEYFFRAEAVVVSPEEVVVDGQPMKVSGLTTSIMEPVCDTKNRKGEVTSTEEHVEKILNEMRKITNDPEFTKGATGADMESLAAAIQEAGPYIKFRTSLGQKTAEFPDPRTWENWDGGKGLENYVPEEAGGVEDESAEAPSANGSGRKIGTPPGSKPTAKAAPEPEFNEFQEQEAEEEATNAEEDLDALAEAAAGEDGDAQARLQELATEAGVSEEDVSGAEDWIAVVELIRQAQGGGEGAEEEAAAEEEEWEPKKEEVYGYKVIDPKTKKPVVDPKTKKPRKMVEVEVTAVNKPKKTVTLKNLDDGRSVYKDVPWDSLEEYK